MVYSGVRQITDIFERRKFSRKSVLWSAELICASGQVLHVIILDISAGGAKLNVEPCLTKGERLIFRSHHGGTRQAHVAWINGDRLGIEFDDWDDSPPSLGAGATG
jgi:hypothetical protein